MLLNLHFFDNFLNKFFIERNSKLLTKNKIHLLVINNRLISKITYFRHSIQRKTKFLLYDINLINETLVVS